MPNPPAIAEFRGHLSALKEHYETILAEYESQVIQAKEQLDHINALMEAPIPAPVTKQKAAPAIKPTKRQPKISTPKAKPVAKVPKKPTTAAKKQTEPRRGPSMVLAPLAGYEGLSKIEAVTKVFQESAVQVLHVDDVIERLYGELNPEEAAAEKIRMKDVMSRGVKRGLWVKVPNLPLSYSLESPVEKQVVSAKKTTKRRSPGSSKGRGSSTRSTPARRPVKLKVQSAYRNQGMSEAIVSILEKNDGKPMSAEDVIPILYGQLNSKEVAVAKKRLHDMFYKGVKAGRMKRFPDKKGAYVLA